MASFKALSFWWKYPQCISPPSKFSYQCISNGPNCAQYCHFFPIEHTLPHITARHSTAPHMESARSAYVKFKSKISITISNGVWFVGTLSHQYINRHIPCSVYTIEVIQLWVAHTICPPPFTVVPFAIQMKGKFQTVLLAMWPRAETKPNCRKIAIVYFCLIGG